MHRGRYISCYNSRQINSKTTRKCERKQNKRWMLCKGVKQVPPLNPGHRFLLFCSSRIVNGMIEDIKDNTNTDIAIKNLIKFVFRIHLRTIHTYIQNTNTPNHKFKCCIYNYTNMYKLVQVQTYILGWKTESPMRRKTLFYLLLRFVASQIPNVYVFICHVSSCTSWSIVKHGSTTSNLFRQ